jgi:hypothetical protein
MFVWLSKRITELSLGFWIKMESKLGVLIVDAMVVDMIQDVLDLERLCVWYRMV